MKNLMLLFSVVYFSVFTGCESRQDVKKISALDDIRNYFDSEIKLLEDSKSTLTKNLDHKGKAEELFIEKPDWENELVPFTETISNQPSMNQAFKKDSVVNGNSRIFHYTANDSSATIKFVYAAFTGEKTDSIVIIKRVSNAYYASTDTLTYYGAGNYLIKAENLPGFGKKIGFVMSGRSNIRN
ncbi:MAG: hypothetical protein M3Q95_12595 [Bacteroidota bacterium]|nr:hypothetical protein [Bacteroidota bacterium]